MNEQTTKLIEQLSSKLGTTAEHLWGVLIRQAPISAITDLLTSGFIVFLVWKSFQIVQRKTKETEESEPDWVEEGAFVAWCIWGLLALISISIVISSVEGIVAGLVNPEFWALKQIIK